MFSWLNKRLGFLGHWLGMGLALDLAKRARLAELFQPKKGLKDKPTTRLELQPLEQREVPLDLWGILTNGFAFGSFSLLPGALDPITAFFRRTFPQPHTDKTVPVSPPPQDGTAPAPSQGTPAPQGSPQPQTSTASNDSQSQQANSTAALDFFNKVEEFLRPQPPRSAMPSQDNAPASAAAAVASSSASVGGTASAADSGGAGMLGLQNNGKYLDPSLLLGDTASSEQNAATGSVNSIDVGAGLRAGEGTPGNAPSSQEEQPVQSASRVVPPTLAQNYGRPPLVFEQNVGQAAEGVSFLSRGPGFNFWLKGDELVFATPRPERGRGEGQGARGGRDVFRMRLVGMNPKAEVVGRDDLPSRSNYFTGSDASGWHSNVPNFGSVLVREAFVGVDLRLRSHSAEDRIFEHDFIVKPGAEVDAVRVRWEGLRSVRVDQQGRLLLQTGGHTLIQEAPIMYQESFGVRTPVQGRYRRHGDDEVGFEVTGGYDRRRPVVIDPSLSFSSYLGGSGDDRAYGVATDLAGNVYVTGETSSSDFPVVNGYDPTLGAVTDVFVAKMSADGKGAIYSTYLGGAGSLGFDGPDIAVSPAGEVVVTGTTSSNSFPTTAGALQTTFTSMTGTQGFVTRLNATGSALLASTYFGNEAYNVSVKGVALGQSGKVYITGAALTPLLGSQLFPVTGGAFQSTHGGDYDSYLSILDVGLSSLNYSTLLGGTGWDEGTAVAVDASENAFVGGFTNAGFTGMGTYQGGAFDGFLVKFNASGTHQAGVAVGASGADKVFGVAASVDGLPFVTGSTDSTAYPTTGGAVQTSLGGSSDAFVTGYTSSLSSRTMSSYLGGTGEEIGYGIGVNVFGEPTIAGRTTSSTLPTYQAFQGTGGGTPVASDGFISKFTSTATLSYSSYHGGTSEDEIRALALHPSGTAVVAGYSNSTDLPGVGGSFQPSNAGGYDAFVSKVLPTPNAPVITTITGDTGTAGNDQITTDQTLEIVGRADPYATVTLERAGVGVLGSVAASSTGLWTYNYTGTTLSDGSYAFAARAMNSANVYSAYSAPEFLVHVDRTAPSLLQTVPSSTTSRGPEVHVAVEDRYGVPTGTTVTLDVDLNNDNDFTDASETGYASGNLVAGQVFIKLPTLSGTGTYRVQARVTDLAGNQGTSSASSFTVTSNTSWASTAQVLSVDPDAGSSTSVLGTVSVTQVLDLNEGPEECACACEGGGTEVDYNSSEVDQHPWVDVDILSVNNATLPTDIDLVLTFNGTTGATVTYNTAGYSPGDVLTASLQAANAITSTGRYNYSVLVHMAGQPDQTITGSTFVVAQDSSPFGAGWTYSGVDRLISIAASGGDPAGMLRVFGGGGWRFYTGTSTFTSPEGDAGTLTLSGGVYTYTAANNAKWEFNSSGYMTSWTSPDGHEVMDYAYDGSNRLANITSHDGSVTTITYNANDVVFQTVNNRTTTLTLSSGNLTKITNPDGGVRTFTYDGNHRLTREQFGTNIENNWEYASTGVVGTIIWGATSVGGVTNESRTVVNPLVTRGNGTFATGSTAYAGFTDALGHTWRENSDARGRVTDQINPLGARTKAEYTNGFLTKSTDALNRVTTFTRDAQGYVTKQTLPDGSVLTMMYAADAFHSLTTMVDARGNTMTYAYDSDGHMTQATDAEGNNTAYAYDDGHLTKVTDARGNATTYLYDALERRTGTIDALNNRTTTTYDANGHTRTSKDSLGRVTTYTNDVMGRTTAVTNALNYINTATYDIAGIALTTTDPLNAQTSAIYDIFKRGLTSESLQVATGLSIGDLASFDALGRASGSRDAAGNFSYVTFDEAGRSKGNKDALGGTTAAQLDPAGQLIASRDALGRWTTFAYDARGRQISATDPSGNTTATAYDKNGNITETIDALGRRTTALYDKNNRATGTIDALTRHTTTAYDAVGNITSQKDHLGRETTYSYDALNRQIRMTIAAGTAVAASTETSYDEVGNIKTTKDALGNVTTSLYDALDRQTTAIDPLGKRTTTLYDALNVTSSIDPLGKRTTPTYDGLHRQTGATNPNGNTTSAILDPLSRIVGSIDGVNNLSQSAFDATGRNAGSLDARSGYAPPAFDSAGQQRLFTDPVGNEWKWEYDSNGRETARIDPTAARTTMQYDSTGRVTKETDRLGRVKEFFYDNGDRNTLTVWKNAALVTVNLLTYTYDSNDNLTSAADNAGTVSYTIDELNRTKSYTNVFGVALTNSYDAASRLTGRTDSLGGVLTSSYDAQNRLTSRQFTGTGSTGNAVRVDIGYSDRGEQTSQKVYSDLAGTTTISHSARSFDDAGRLTSIVNKDSGNATLSYYNYGYDNADRVTSHTYWSQIGTVTYSGNKTYTYDFTSQLTNDGNAYSYDANGNRTMAGYTTGAANRISNDGTWTYTYGAEGNTTQKSKGSGLETWYYTFDHNNRLTNIRQTSNGSTNLLLLTYTYDVQDNRVQEDSWKTGIGNATTRFHYDTPGGNVVIDTDSSNVATVRRQFAEGVDRVLLRTVASGAQAGVSVYLTDNLGSVRDMVDVTSAVKGHIDYSGFGLRSEAGLAWLDRFGFTAREWQFDAGLNYHRARWYDPARGEWISDDPIHFHAGDANLSRFVANNATNLTDSSGLVVVNTLKNNKFTIDDGRTAVVTGEIDVERKNIKDWAKLTFQTEVDNEKSLADYHWLQFAFRYQKKGDKYIPGEYKVGQFYHKYATDDKGTGVVHVDTLKSTSPYYDATAEAERDNSFRLIIWDKPTDETDDDAFTETGTILDAYLVNEKCRKVYYHVRYERRSEQKNGSWSSKWVMNGDQVTEVPEILKGKKLFAGWEDDDYKKPFSFENGEWKAAFPKK